MKRTARGPCRSGLPFAFGFAAALPLVLAAAPAEAHLMITEIGADTIDETGYTSEYVELYNPGPDSVNLAEFWLTNDVAAYYTVVNGPVAAASFDFFYALPTLTLGAGEIVVICQDSTTFLAEFFGGSLTAFTDQPGVQYLVETTFDGFSDGVPEAVDFDTQPGVNLSLSNAAECVGVGYWDGSSDLVVDHDWVCWGATTGLPNKTGVTIDGPDPGTTPSAYSVDAGSLSAAPVASLMAIHRASLYEAFEIVAAGNGVDGHDETSEQWSGWIDAAHSPGVAGPFGCTGVPDGTACNDGLFCTVGETCSGGACAIAIANDCSDANPCTVDSCDELADLCVHDPLPLAGTICDDGLYCTEGDVCAAGVCAGPTLRDCSDASDCTMDSCNEGADSCLHDTAPLEGMACDDGLFCNSGETCAAGICGGGGATDCADADQCTIDSCDEAGDACVNDAAAAEGDPCDDGLFCTVDETCAAGACGGGAPNPCLDASGCTADTCDEAGGACLHDGAPLEGMPCDDGLFCTTAESCTAGACGGGAAIDCADTNPCTADGCDETGDACVHDGAPVDGQPCDDGLFCTAGEACAAGACAGGAANGCSDGNACTLDSCDEPTDACLHDAPGADGDPCDDGLFCTTGEICAAGSCGGGGARSCADTSACTVDACDEAGDACVADPAPLEGSFCDDGAFCTAGETCGAGVCGGGGPNGCSDGDTCTDDSCDETLDACTHAPVADGTGCAAAGGCEVGGTCAAGVCGAVVPAPSGTACDDGDQCTTGETCDGAGACGGAAVPIVCDDLDPCTTDGCVPVTGCSFVGLPEGTACDDGLFCTSGTLCTAGACAGGLPTSCDDSNDCTADACDAVAGACLHDGAAREGETCDDQDPCTDGDVCAAGVCGGTPARGCATDAGADAGPGSDAGSAGADAAPGRDGGAAGDAGPGVGVRGGGCACAVAGGRGEGGAAAGAVLFALFGRFAASRRRRRGRGIGSDGVAR